ncbi:hypothetical protein I603_1071 [Erythrobacter dokdonensis DSW-74]|uniref:Uncharacterized protein n=1 Tax=Erythrobacter dokdonensis DSW-74 TaxID=1300349 RepID=A0A1A7BGF9_9SPHN|nr:hypothetical protein I603_1071 [Erythrobacter dokdonensis DSW-74]
MLELSRRLAILCTCEMNSGQTANQWAKGPSWPHRLPNPRRFARRSERPSSCG